MKHHFSDELDRSNGHWSIVPNQDRWKHHYGDLADAPATSSILTVTKDDLNWTQLGGLEQLNELTLDNPSRAQVEFLGELTQLTSLRISFARPKTLTFLAGQTRLRELVLEYVSGVESLDVLGGLPSLTALHLENLRRVSDFSGLSSSDSLRYLSIDGTLDWNQPIEGLDFLSSLDTLEYLRLMKVRVLASSPVLGSIASMRRLREIRLSMAAFPLEEYAYLEARNPHLKGAVSLPYIFSSASRHKIEPPDIRAKVPVDEFREYLGSHVAEDGQRYIDEPAAAYLLGKGTRTISGVTKKVLAKCEAHAVKYKALVDKETANL